MVEYFTIFQRICFLSMCSCLYCTYQCYARGGGGGPRDRVGTLIKNKNLESNFLTLGISFQFNVSHPGKRLYAIKVLLHHGMRWHCSFHFHYMVDKIVFTLQVDFSRSDHHGFNCNFASVSCGLRQMK